MYTYSYLYACLALAPFWLFFFVSRADLRQTMLKLSALFGIGGVLSEFIYISDWWNPVTVTGTPVGIEDFLFGFFFSGSAAVCYEICFKTAYEDRQHPLKWPFKFRYIALLICSFFFGSAILFDLDSFTATILAFGTCSFLMLAFRRDLLINALFSSIFAGALAFVFFGIPELLTPGWIKATWSMNYLSGHVVIYVPLEDFIWFLMAGAFIGPLYKFWKNKGPLAIIREQDSFPKLQSQEC
ncbi:hypothetical protein AL013_00655 [Mariprofundus ferrooxydans]|uniref:Lycopene cyclase domain-containing protein n=2 Tax=Mariprofundus ferrooxydans TaxID=314344 RepID=Q0EXY0_9PROT|nr:lycopene cyclase domain-containing protein [Mariprofundus ferrooxydans]EAU54072.1 hypothetical protein SPV1_00542 [Mariprofundus ferrooxydans PV-1]KON48877.1 hypothetical protein AL013_00655 [Mariprofundus ferrooxydans]